MKVIQVEMPDGKYNIPLEFVAKHRAKYYAKLDADKGEGTFEENYKSEVDYVMNDDYEGIDWLSNSMDWSDVVGVAVKAGEPEKPDMSDAFCNAEKEIVDIQE